MKDKLTNIFSDKPILEDNFNSIRITLAIPEKIKSSSFKINNTL